MFQSEWSLSAAAPGTWSICLAVQAIEATLVSITYLRNYFHLYAVLSWLFLHGRRQLQPHSAGNCSLSFKLVSGIARWLVVRLKLLNLLHRRSGRNLKYSSAEEC